jgi:hypothetical protein
LLYSLLYTPLQTIQHGAPHSCTSVTSHRRRCGLGASPSRARVVSKAAVYEDRLARARRRRWRWSQTSLGGRGIGRRANQVICCIRLLYISLYIKLLYEGRKSLFKWCYTRTRVASRPSIVTIQRYTALYIIQLYSAIHYTTSTPSLWLRREPKRPGHNRVMPPRALWLNSTSRPMAARLACIRGVPGGAGAALEHQP